MRYFVFILMSKTFHSRASGVVRANVRARHEDTSKKTHYLSASQKSAPFLEEWDRKIAEGEHVTLEDMCHWEADKLELSFTPLNSTISRIFKNRANIFTIDAANCRKNLSRVDLLALDATLAD